MINCQQASLLVEQQLHESLTLRQRLALGIHLLICKACKIFAHQAASIRGHLRNDSNELCGLSDEARERIAERLRQEAVDRHKPSH